MSKQPFCLFLDIVIFFTFSLQCKILCANKIFRTDIERLHTAFRTRITLYDQSFLITISVVLGNGKGAALLKKLAAVEPDTIFSKQ